MTNTKGYSVYAYKSLQQVIEGCTFKNNEGPVNIDLQRTSADYTVRIVNSSFTDGLGTIGSTAGLNISTTKNANIRILYSRFFSNDGRHLSIVSKGKLSSVNLLIKNSEFSKGSSNTTYSTVIEAKENITRNMMSCVIANCTFVDNSHGALQVLKLLNVTINNCTVRNTNGTGISISKKSYRHTTSVTNISNSVFENNNRALLLNIKD